MRSGLQTTVQDLGRWGFQSLGVPVAGAMDPFSHRLANLLAGNRAEAATLEVTLVGPELLFDEERTVAVAGAEFRVTVDGRAVPHARAFPVPRGAVLQFGQRISGARAYLAVAGGIDVPPVLGSRSTHVPGRLGGIGGRALVAGDQVPLGHRPSANGPLLRTPPASSLPLHGPCVRVVPGPDQDRFPGDALDVLQSAPYRVEPDSDRMGFRLAGPTLDHTRGADIISDATPVGTLQVPASGQPLLLMADRQTTGGYARLATVITADVGVAAQVAPGGTISFQRCTPREAVAALIARERALLAVGAGTP